MLKYFDAHTHVNFSAFKNDYKETIHRALDAGVSMILVGTQQDTSRRAVEIAHEFNEGVYAAVGLHPVHTDRSYHDEQELGAPTNVGGFTSRGEEFSFEFYKKLAEDPKVVTIGECGLDYYRNEQIADRESQIEKQKKVFEAQIELAHAVKKPLMVHCRDAYPDVLDLLQTTNYKLQPSVIHFFAGDVDTARKFLDLGFSFTFGGAITFPPRKGKQAGDYDEVIRFIPNDRILSETDAPYVAPIPHRGKRNEPAYIVEVVKRLAEVKDVPLEAMAGHIMENAERVFSI